MGQSDFMMISTEYKLGSKISIWVRFTQFLFQVLLKMDKTKLDKVTLTEIKTKITLNLFVMTLLLSMTMRELRC